MQQETFLPVFPGFYNTIFEPDLVEADENYFLSEDCFEVQNCDLEPACRQMVHEVETELQRAGIDVKLEFQHLESPREYNFRNDTININVSYDSEAVKTIKQFLIKDIELFTGYLKDNYTSYDGFISGHSTDVLDWLESFSTNSHKFGAVLDFILQAVLDYSEGNLYDAVCNELYDYEVIEPKFQEILDQIDNYIRENYLHTDREMMAKALFTNFGENVGYECTFDPDFFMHLTNKVYNEIESKVGKLF